jgi:ferritin-like metal-binding protein YciE
MHTLQHLLVHEVQDLYSAEKQLVDALPKMVEKASHPQLKAAFQMHLGETERHVTRLEQIAQMLDIDPDEVTCKAMKGLIKEAEEVIDEGRDPAVTDAGLIGAAQKVEHYEMAGYGTARTHAQTLGLTEIARILQQTLDEEGAANKKLTDLAESTAHINRFAQAAVA